MKQLKTVGSNNVASRYGRTPYKRVKSQNSDNNSEKSQDPVEVYCRLRPLINSQDVMCITLQSPRTVTLNPPDSTKSRKVLQYGFKHVFTEHTTQKEIFETIALPLLEGLLHGKNGLLFTYGVTGSGKTYTMTGDPNDPGLMPRCINTLFNTISEHQTPKYLIKSDKMNGFEVQMPADALNERLKEAKSRSKSSIKNKGSTEFITNYSNDGVDLNSIQENCLFSVFVNYIEIYNNTVYDLLDDTSGSKLQPKILREDWSHGMYVNGVVELEVKSAEEAFELFNIGQKCKRTAHTVMNTESSRSHSIFTLRLVQGLFDSTGEQMSKMGDSLIVSQLSLVDLAGSERCSRTQTTGQRLKEAGSINNSLMSLRACLEILRENQMQGTNKIVPYRDSRLTLLFKNYFDGEGKVEMIVCVNPSANDYDETLQVMKFAEITQEVRIARPESKEHLLQEIIMNNKADKEKAAKKARSVGNLLEDQYLEFREMRPFKFSDNYDEQNVDSLYKYLKLRVEKKRARKSMLTEKRDAFRQKLLQFYESSLILKTQIKDLRNIEKKKHVVSKKLEDEKLQMEVALDNLAKEVDKKDSIIEELQNTLKEKSFKLNQNILTVEEEKRRMEEKIMHECDAKLRYQRELLEAARKEETEKIELVKDILNNEPVFPRSDIQSIKSSILKKSIETPVSKRSEEIQVDTRVCHSSRKIRATPVANPRYRRSRSAGDVWIEHRPSNPVPLGTVLQPHIKRRKSITKLTSVKDITGNKQCKYLLIDQGADEVGDLETKLYKGDIIPTCTGGAQIVFDDVEKLKQESPTAGTPKNRPTIKRNYYGINYDDASESSKKSKH